MKRRGEEGRAGLLIGLGTSVLLIGLGMSVCISV